MRIFPDAQSCLRLVRALAAETHETWLEAMRYLNMEHLAEHKKEMLRKLDEPKADDGGPGACVVEAPRPSAKMPAAMIPICRTLWTQLWCGACLGVRRPRSYGSDQSTVGEMEFTLSIRTTTDKRPLI